MAKIRFIKQKKAWGKRNRELFPKVSEIIDDYMEKNILITLRQLYYQLVSLNLIENTKNDYNKLSILLKNARYFGLIDWDAIVDRNRQAIKHPEFEDIPDLLDSALSSYRKDRHRNQDNYIEIWCEKDALASVIEPITDKYHLTLLVDKGFNSVSAMFDAVKRFSDEGNAKGKDCYILYLGDHDPSGLNMVDVIRKKLEIFNVGLVYVKRLALTLEQIDNLNPDSQPVKMTDTRSKKYIEKYGYETWEVDTLSSEYIQNLLVSEIERFIDMDLYNEIVKEEESEKQKLVEMIEKMDD